MKVKTEDDVNKFDCNKIQCVSFKLKLRNGNVFLIFVVSKISAFSKKLSSIKSKGIFLLHVILYVYKSLEPTF